MKITSSAALAALIGAVAAKDERTFAVLRFNNKQLTKGRMDPIISPGKTSSHVHTVMGASNFGIGSTGETIVNSQCTNAMIKGDNSNYWFPSLYFQDPSTKKFESVDVFYVNAYYFFEATNDQIKAFPTGLQMVAGEAMSRVAPEAGASSNLDPSKGPINAAKWTCPRNGNNYEPPSWPAGSDGSLAGIGDPINKGEGVGFPDVSCDGYASPLRADIHFPSCYNPELPLNDYKNNMEYPQASGDGKVDCPQGWIHVPHLFLEVYWDTPAFEGRWTPNTGNQPFVLSNGDATGFSSHADFMAGWDEKVLQNIIDTCDAGTLGMDTCPGVTVNKEDCTIPSEVDEKVDGVLDQLPGINMLAGWSYGLDGLMAMPEPTTAAAPAPKPAAPEPKPEASIQAEALAPRPATPEPKPEVSVQAEAPVAEPLVVEAPVVVAPVVQAPELPKPSIVAVTTAAPQVEQPIATATACTKKKIVTVWETVTVTAGTPEATLALNALSVANINTTNTVSGFKLAGCFKDSKVRVLNGLVPALGPLSNEKCVSHCKDAGFILAGTEYGTECFCGNELVGSEKVDDSECSMPCSEDSADTCGGHWALSVYSETGEASLKSAKVRRGAHGHLHGHRRSHYH